MVSLTVERDDGIVGGDATNVLTAANVSASEMNAGAAVTATSETQLDGSSQDAEEQAETNSAWHDLTAQIPGSDYDQDLTGGGPFSDPNDFWSCLGPWLGDEANSLWQGWGYGDFDGLGSSDDMPLM